MRQLAKLIKFVHSLTEKELDEWIKAQAIVDRYEKRLGAETESGKK